MRALGASPMHVIAQVITEAVVLTTFAGYFGLVCGVGLLELVNYAMVSSGGDIEMFHQPGVDFNVAVTALTILIVCGAAAGFIPARRAVSVKPIDALRYE
jgi:putative ABC transport system permease protein